MRHCARAVLCGGPASPAAAATYRVDDSSSCRASPRRCCAGDRAAPARDADDTLEGTVGVAVRLNLAPWLNRTGRLFLVFPEQGTPLVRVSWRTQGRLLPGEILPGQRVLVYEGPITITVPRRDARAHDRGERRSVTWNAQPGIPFRNRHGLNRMPSFRLSSAVAIATLAALVAPVSLAQEFAAVVSPPRFEIVRQSRRAFAPGRRDHERRDPAVEVHAAHGRLGTGT